MYVVTFPAVIGPVFEEQAVTLPVPLMDQLRVPEGAAELLAPVTVAVKVKGPPRVGAPEGTSKIVGVAGATTVEVEDGIPDTAL